jgi:hypothetical protein
VLQQQINQIRRFLSNAQTPDSVIALAILAVTVSFLCFTLSRFKSGPFRNPHMLWIVALTLGMSPSLVGWSRAILTETLSVAIALWLLAVLIKSLHDRRLHYLSVSMVLILGIFVRYDFALFTFPVAIIGFYLHSMSGALRRGATICLIIFMPLGGWALRSVSLGLDPTPPYGLTQKGQPLPKGMLRWVSTWLDDQYELRSSAWALAHYNYRGFSPAPGAYFNSEEKARVELLLGELRNSYQGKPPPEEIDKIFGNLAKARLEKNFVDQWVLLPIRRIGNMWLSPFPSMGLPAEVADDLRPRLQSAISSKDFSAIFDILITMPGTAATKLLVAGHHYLLLLVVFIVVIGWRHRILGGGEMLAKLIVSFAIFRSLAFSFTFLTETRYLVPAIAWLDVLLAIVLANWLSGRKVDKLN